MIIVLVLSLLLAIPGFFIFWIILLIAFHKGIIERDLFRTALYAALILSIITALVCLDLLFAASSVNSTVISLSIVLSAITSVMMHFRYFKTIN